MVYNRAGEIVQQLSAASLLEDPSSVPSILTGRFTISASGSGVWVSVLMPTYTLAA